MGKNIEFSAHRPSEEKYYVVSAAALANVIADQGLGLNIAPNEDNTCFTFSEDGKELFQICEFWGIELRGERFGSKLQRLDPEPGELGDAIMAALAGEDRKRDRLTFAEADETTQKAVSIVGRFEKVF